MDSKIIEVYKNLLRELVEKYPTYLERADFIGLLFKLWDDRYEIEGMAIEYFEAMFAAGIKVPGFYYIENSSYLNNVVHPDNIPTVPYVYIPSDGYGTLGSGSLENVNLPTDLNYRILFIEEPDMEIIKKHYKEATWKSWKSEPEFKCRNVDGSSLGTTGAVMQVGDVEGIPTFVTLQG